MKLAALILFTLQLSCVTLHAQDKATPSCETEKKADYYKQFLAAYEGDGQNIKAGEAAKNYLACGADSTNDPEVLAKMNLAVGRLLMARNSSSAAISYIVNAISYDSPIKQSAQVYANLAHAYEDGPYARLADDYRMKFTGKDDTPASRVAVEALYPIIDRIIDSYARSLALLGPTRPKIVMRGGSGLRPISSSDPTEWMNSLIALFKFRHKGATNGLEEFIDMALSKPLPSP